MQGAVVLKIVNCSEAKNIEVAREKRKMAPKWRKTPHADQLLIARLQTDIANKRAKLREKLEEQMKLQKRLMEAKERQRQLTREQGKAIKPKQESSGCFSVSKPFFTEFDTLPFMHAYLVSMV